MEALLLPSRFATHNKTDIMNNTKAVQEMLTKIVDNATHAKVFIAQANLFLKQERENMSENIQEVEPLKNAQI